MHDADDADAPPAGFRVRLSQYMGEAVRVPFVLPMVYGLAANCILVGLALQDALFWVVAAPYAIASSVVAARSLRHYWRMAAITTGRHYGFRLLRLLLGRWATTRSMMLGMIFVMVLGLLQLLGMLG